jgi:hypothetical protein
MPREFVGKTFLRFAFSIWLLVLGTAVRAGGSCFDSTVVSEIERDLMAVDAIGS